MVPIYIDVDNKRRVTQYGGTVLSPLDFIWQVQHDYEVHFLNCSVQPPTHVDMSAITGWTAIVDKDVIISTTPLVKVLNANIDSSNSVNGIIKILFDCNSSSFASAVDGHIEISGYWEIMGFDSDGDKVFDTTIKNALLHNCLDPNNVNPPPDPVSDYYDKSEIDAITSGLLSSSDTTVTKQGNSFNGSSELVQTTSDGKLPILDGSNLTNIDAGIQTLSSSTPTTLTGIIKGNGSTLAVAQSGVDYVATNDSRLSDARTPTTHNHPESDIIGLVDDLNHHTIATDSSTLTSSDVNKIITVQNVSAGYADLPTINSNIQCAYQFESGNLLSEANGGTSLTQHGSVVSTANGKHGNYAYFNNSGSNYLSRSLSITPKYTAISYWHKNSSAMRLVGSSGIGFAVCVYSGTAMTKISTTVSDYTVSGSVTSTGWHHVLAYVSTSHLYLYYDGLLINSIAISGTPIECSGLDVGKVIL